MMESGGVHRSEMGKIAHAVRKYPSLFVVFTVYKTFAVVLFMEGFLFPGTFQLGGYTLPTLVLFILMCAGVCLFFAFRFKKVQVFDKNGYLWFLVVSMTLGVFFLFMETHAGISNDTLRLVTLGLGIASLGVGLMGIHIELGRLFGMLGMTPTLTYGIASALATAVLATGIALLPSTAVWVLMFVFPALTVLAFFFAKQRAFPDQKVLYRQSTNELLIPYRFMATSLTQGLALGIPLGFLSFSGFFGQFLDSAGYFFAALLAFLVVLVLQMDFNRSVYQIGFPLAGLGLLSVGAFAGMPAIAAVLQLAAFLYLDLVLWGLGSYLIKNNDQPATWVASCPSTALMTGRALGIVIGSIALQSLPNAEQTTLFFAAAAFLVMLAGLLLSNSANLKTGWGFVRPGDPRGATDVYRTCEIIAQDFGLTQRELEIMHSIVVGKTRKAISEDLFITPNTIKTHLHNLYGKLDLHSEGDLKAFVAKQEKMFSTEENVPSIPVESA
ncbi:MAG: helix-turn-helix transcriptional regulator [Gordonibacter sp.]|uniref:helix-turn-helix transcriptional regulator n=2 Tax=Gordonibacter sp. TaxID=1968902 RepID=UPI002FC95CB7